MPDDIDGIHVLDLAPHKGLVREGRSYLLE
jgi:hypothetical protein